MKKLNTALLIVALLASSKVLATDGVVEINHICATQLGCFNGDSVNYPVRIDGTAGKSYRLTSDLIIPNENTNGIDIAASNVSIDLNGFSIVRSGCESTNVDCTSVTGTGRGINVGLTSYFGLVVKNGSIIGMGQRGISNIGSHAHFENLHLRWNRESTISVGEHSKILNSIISNNGGSGIYLDQGSIAKNNTVSFNGGTGINAQKSTIVIENTIYENGSTGISIFQENSIAKNNTVYQNSGTGISCGHGSVASFNNVHSNGGDGISVIDGCNVHENTISENTGFGIDVSTGIGQNINVLQRNVMIGNVAGTIDGSNYFDLGKNFCDTNDVCP